MERMEQILIVVIGVLLVAAVQEIAPRFSIAPPLVLMVIGAIIGITPWVPAISVDPEWILVGVLPPLLYSAAVSMPTMDFRRDLGTIGALSFVLVVVSAVGLGFFFTWVLPEISLATGIALGAILSPTDAVAVSMAKKLGVPGRVTAVLEGESLLNDASALVLLRAAIVATTTSISFVGVALNFLYGVVAAVAIGALVGFVTLRLRARSNPTVNTAISFVVPFIAYLPAEHLGASGLVAAVAAGLVTGAGAARYLTPQHRISDSMNWRTVELMLEGGVFLLMGLELYGLVVDVHRDHDGIVHAAWLGLSGLAVALVIRALYVAPLVWWLGKATRRATAQTRPVLQGMSDRIADGASHPASAPEKRGGFLRRTRHRRLDADLGDVGPATASHYSYEVAKRLADIDYYESYRIGPKEGTLIVWAGLRGVVTVAAAQTLPSDTPARSLLVLIAFTVAAASLLGQGGTLSWLIRRLKLDDISEDLGDERRRLQVEMITTAKEVMSKSEAVAQFPWLKNRIERQEKEADEDQDATGPALTLRQQYEQVRRDVIAAQRHRLLKLRHQGAYNSELLTAELRQLDAEEISLDVRAGNNE